MLLTALPGGERVHVIRLVAGSDCPEAVPILCSRIVVHRIIERVGIEAPLGADAAGEERTARNVARRVVDGQAVLVGIVDKPEGNPEVIRGHLDGAGVNRIPVMRVHINGLDLAELIMNQYQEVYFFNSIAACAPISCKKFCLAKLIVFDSKDSEDLFWTFLRKNLGTEIASVEFVDLDLPSASC